MDLNDYLEKFYSNDFNHNIKYIYKKRLTIKNNKKNRSSFKDVESFNDDKMNKKESRDSDSFGYMNEEKSNNEDFLKYTQYVAAESDEEKEKANEQDKNSEDSYFYTDTPKLFYKSKKNKYLKKNSHESNKNNKNIYKNFAKQISLDISFFRSVRSPRNVKIKKILKSQKSEEYNSIKSDENESNDSIEDFKENGVIKLKKINDSNENVFEINNEEKIKFEKKIEQKDIKNLIKLKSYESINKIDRNEGKKDLNFGDLLKNYSTKNIISTSAKFL